MGYIINFVGINIHSETCTLLSSDVLWRFITIHLPHKSKDSIKEIIMVWNKGALSSASHERIAYNQGSNNYDILRLYDT